MGLITTIQNKTEQARAKERIRPLLESRMMRDILLEIGQRGTEKLDPQSVPLDQRPLASKRAAECFGFKTVFVFWWAGGRRGCPRGGA